MEKRINSISTNKSWIKNAMIFLICILLATFLKCIELQNRNSKRAVEERLHCIEQLVKENHQKLQKN